MQIKKRKEKNEKLSNSSNF